MSAIGNAHGWYVCKERSRSIARARAKSRVRASERNSHTHKQWLHTTCRALKAYEVSEIFTNKQPLSGWVEVQQDQPYENFNEDSLEIIHQTVLSRGQDTADGDKLHKLIWHIPVDVLRTYMHTYKHTHKYTSIRTYIHANIHETNMKTQEYIHEYIHVYIHE